MAVVLASSFVGFTSARLFAPQNIAEVKRAEILVLGMKSIDVLEITGEPDNISERKDDIYGWYFRTLEMPPHKKPLKHVYLVFQKGRLAVIRKGSSGPESKLDILP